MLPSNYIEIKKNPDSDIIEYDLSAEVLPENAVDKTLLYQITSFQPSNNDSGKSLFYNQNIKNIANENTSDVNGKVDENGIFRASKLGTYVINISSANNSYISSNITINVSENFLSPVTKENLTSIYGTYEVDQFKIDYGEYINVPQGTSSVNVHASRDSKEDKIILNTDLYFNGLKISLLPKDTSTFENLTFEEIAQRISDRANLEIVSENRVRVALEGRLFTNLVDSNIIKEDEILYLSLIKKEDKNPNNISISTDLWCRRC